MTFKLFIYALQCGNDLLNIIFMIQRVFLSSLYL